MSDRRCRDLAEQALAGLAGAIAADIDRLAQDIAQVCEDVRREVEGRARWACDGVRSAAP